MSIYVINKYVIFGLILTIVYTFVILFVAKYYKKELSWNFILKTSLFIPVNLFLVFELFYLIFGRANIDVLLFISFFIFVFIITLIVLLAVKYHIKELSRQFIINTSFLVPISLVVLFFTIRLIHNFYTSPMKVNNSDLEGDYVINTDMFKGSNADWQYQHYWLKIKYDTLYLNVMNNGKLIKIFKKKVYKTRRNKHEFIEFYDKYQLDREEVRYARVYIRDNYDIILKDPSDTIIRSYETVTDSVFYSRVQKANEGEHHMLKLNPLLHADPFMFNIVLRSTKYGNMFFRKGKWEDE